MEKAKVKSLFITVIIFLGLGYMLFGKFNLSDFSKFMSIKNVFKKEKSISTKKKKKKRNNNSSSRAGKVIDNYKGVGIYYNGSVGNVYGRNVTNDGYNLGLKYQCVEFAKRFYYEAYNHKMADSYGHAKDFFDTSLPSGAYNKSRGMYQFNNKSKDKPRVDDLCVIGPSPENKFGHLFIITKVKDGTIEFVQQNGGANNSSRGNYELIYTDGSWYIRAPYILGWLRMP